MNRGLVLEHQAVPSITLGPLFSLDIATHFSFVDESASRLISNLWAGSMGF
jgi:hypothetical protein